MIQRSKPRHSGDAGGLKLFHLAAADARHMEKAVFGLPDTFAVIRPAAQRTIGTGDRPCRGRRGGKAFQPRARRAGVMGIIGKAQRRARPIAQFDMGFFGKNTLHFGQQIGIEHELQHVLGVRPALQLGIGHLITEVAQGRGSFDPQQKV